MIKPIGDKNILDKKVATSKKFENVKASVDSGYNMKKFMDQHGDGLNARFKREEHFKRMKVSTLAKMLKPEQDSLSMLSLSTQKTAASNAVDAETILLKEMLLLDIRDAESYEQCHIQGAVHYPYSKLSHSVNYFTAEIMSFRNRSDRVIVIYDDDEKFSVPTGNQFFEKDTDVIVVSGGLKKFVERYPELLVGTPPAHLLASAASSSSSSKRSSLSSSGSSASSPVPSPSPSLSRSSSSASMGGKSPASFRK